MDQGKIFGPIETNEKSRDGQSQYIHESSCPFYCRKP